MNHHMKNTKELKHEIFLYPSILVKIQDGMNGVTLWYGIGNGNPVPNSFSRIRYHFSV